MKFTKFLMRSSIDSASVVSASRDAATVGTDYFSRSRAAPPSSR
jgi:hypothetical protein